MTPANTYILGVDPAATTGFALCLAEPGGLRLLEAWHVTRRTPGRRAPGQPNPRSQAECDAAFVHLVKMSIDEKPQPHLPIFFDGHLEIAIEDPSDVSARWSHVRQEGRVSGRGTACRIGAAYGLALAGVTVGQAPDRIMSYQVRGTAKKAGWMVGLFGRRATRQDVYDRLRAAIRASSPTHTACLPEDELAAYGVALWHWTLSRAKAKGV